MLRPAARLLFFFVSAVLLTGFFTPSAHADAGPALTAKFGIAGRYKPGGWCLVTVGVTNPGPDTVTGQLQVVAANIDTGPSPFGRRGGRANTPNAVFACPVSVPGGTTSPHYFPLYLRGIDPGQADLTVQLVEGRERGDGRVLAKISNQNPNEVTAFSGSPITSGDPLFVGFGGDPGAFLFLNGQRLPTGHPALPAFPQPGFSQPGGMVGTLPTFQVAEAAAADLPDRAAGYGGVSAFLLRSDAPLEALTEAQADALKAWVAGGGYLIVCGGSDPSRFGSAFFNGLLPAAVGPIGAAGELTLTPKPLPGVHVFLSSAQKTQSVSGPYGAGTVMLTAFDPAAPAYANTAAPIWRTLLWGHFSDTTTASALGMIAQREENYNAFYFGNTPPLLSEAVMRGPSLDAPGTAVIAVFLLAYLVILVPVNYLVLKRLDRKEWAWGTIPALVLLFAAGTFGVGYAAKGGSVFVNRAALIETSAGRREAGVYSEVGLFSPRRSSYDITLTGDNMASAIPNPGADYSGRGGDRQDAGAAQFVETPAGVSLPSTPVNMWAMRAFDVQSATDLGGTIDGSLSYKTGMAAGTITNHTPSALTDCAVFYQDRWMSLGSLAAGASLAVPGAGLTHAQPGGLSLPVPPVTDQSDIHARMQASLAEYFRSLGDRRPSYSGMNPGLTYAPAPGEALFAGWSRDSHLAGQTPKIDGQPVTENDETLVIVHIPVSGAPQPAVFIPPPSVIRRQLGLGFGTSMRPGNLVAMGFGIVGRATLSYHQSRDIRTLSAVQAAALIGHVVRLRGTVFSLSQRGGPATLRFAPSITPSGVAVLLPFLGGHDLAARSLVGREIIVTGTLTRSRPGVQLVVDSPNFVQVVP